MGLMSLTVTMPIKVLEFASFLVFGVFLIFFTALGGVFMPAASFERRLHPIYTSVPAQ
jgi:hypothetical protein